jgi:hypothetical protein
LEEHHIMKNWLESIGSTGFVVLGAALTVVACSSAAADKYPSSDSFCEAKATEECQVTARCGVTEGSCLTVRKAACSSFVSSSASGSRQYRPGNAEACINKTHDVYGATAPITPTIQGEIDAVCSKVFQGTTKALGACTVTTDCEGDLICDKKLCANKVTKNSGDLCGNPGEICSSGSFCDTFSGGAAQCKPKKARDEACDAEKNPCNESLRCNNTCRDRFVAGESCGSNDDCASSAPFCDPTNSNKCGAGLIFAPGAGSCKAYGG